jgi:hypothetical protein
VKPEILENLIKGHSGFSLFIRLISARVLKVTAACLALTLIVWLLWIGKFTFAAFLTGAGVGLVIFLTRSYLRRHLAYPEANGNSATAKEPDNLADPKEVRPKTSVED